MRQSKTFKSGYFRRLRNQPRKKIDLTFRAFAEFAKGKPENVKLYLHMGSRDSSMDIVKLAERYEVDNRLIVTSLAKGPQQVPIENLNLIYNCTDIGVNTSVGEGWGLCSVEHSLTGAPQIVGNFSAMQDLYQDCGLLVNGKLPIVLDNIMTTGQLVDPIDVAEKMELLYTNHDLYNDLAAKAKKKFTSKEYSWKKIAQLWDNLFLEVINTK